MVYVTFGEAMVLGFAVHVVGAWAATLFAFWHGHYFVPGAALAFGLGLLLLLPLTVIALSRIEELAAVVFGLRPRRLLPARPADAVDFAPKEIGRASCRERR